MGNCVLLCRFHHRLVHEGGWTVGWWGPGRAVFYDPRGGTHFDGRWQPSEIESAWEPEEGPVEGLIQENHRHGVRPDGWTAAARWKREADVPDEVYFRALEAMG